MPESSLKRRRAVKIDQQNKHKERGTRHQSVSLEWLEEQSHGTSLRGRGASYHKALQGILSGKNTVRDVGPHELARSPEPTSEILSVLQASYICVGHPGLT